MKKTAPWSQHSGTMVLFELLELRTLLGSCISPKISSFLFSSSKFSNSFSKKNSAQRNLCVYFGHHRFTAVNNWIRYQGVKFCKYFDDYLYLPIQWKLLRIIQDFFSNHLKTHSVVIKNHHQAFRGSRSATCFART